MKKKIKLDTTIRLKPYWIVSDAVSYAVDGGYNRAIKHCDTERIPGHEVSESIKQRIEEYVMSALCDIIDFGGDGDD